MHAGGLTRLLAPWEALVQARTMHDPRCEGMITRLWLQPKRVWKTENQKGQEFAV